jgi:hypothetical protein
MAVKNVMNKSAMADLLTNDEINSPFNSPEAVTFVEMRDDDDVVVVVNFFVAGCLILIVVWWGTELVFCCGEILANVYMYLYIYDIMI